MPNSPEHYHCDSLPKYRLSSALPNSLRTRPVPQAQQTVTSVHASVNFVSTHSTPRSPRTTDEKGVVTVVATPYPSPVVSAETTGCINLLEHA